MSYAWQQRLRLALVVISPTLFTLQVIGALQNPHSFGWLIASFWAALGIYIAYDYRRAKAAHEALPTRGKARPGQGGRRG
jgi:hypothetical protein